MTAYNNTTAAAQSTGWIFGKFDPGMEHRNKQGSDTVVERRKKVVYVRYRLHFGAITFSNQEGTISVATDLASTNGTGASGSPLGSTSFILSDHTLDNEGGQGSAMWRETEVWEAFSTWEVWDTIEDDLGVNPF